MVSFGSILFAMVGYLGVLFAVALYAERRHREGVNIANNGVVYSLSMAVYCTAWTFYGSVGFAASKGFLFLTTYFGPTLAMLLAWSLQRKFIRIKEAQRVTSVADLISARYGRSAGLASLVTVLTVLAVVPYIALQMKAIMASANMILDPGALGSSARAIVGGNPVTVGPPSIMADYRLGPTLGIAMILFTIAFGQRRLDPTERHPGMVAALAVESLVKLIAFLAVGIFVTYVIHDGFSHLLKIDSAPFMSRIAATRGPGSTVNWISYVVVSFSAFLLLPRQFQIGVVENVKPQHLRTAVWLFPLYLLLINLFIIPITIAGLHAKLDSPDTFVLKLPLLFEYKWLAVVVFIGGFSAAAGMIMLEAMAIAPMISNHLMLPMLTRVSFAQPLVKRLLALRRLAAAGIIGFGYFYGLAFAETSNLAGLGFTSFLAMTQLLPAVIGGLYWRQGNRTGAIWGISAGMVLWAYTTLIPMIAKARSVSTEFLGNGPWGVSFLAPERFLGIGNLDPIAHGFVVTMAFNVAFYVLGSLIAQRSEIEELRVEEFTVALGGLPRGTLEMPPPGVGLDKRSKVAVATKVLAEYVDEPMAEKLVSDCLEEMAVAEERLTLALTEVAELQHRLELILSGAIGTAAAHAAVTRGGLMSAEEQDALSRFYAKILSEARVSPAELSRRIDYYRDRERLLTEQARQLEQKIQDLRRENRDRLRAEAALKVSEEKYRTLVDTINVGMFRTTVDGRIVHLNPTAIEMFGYKNEPEALKSVSAELLYVSKPDREAFLGDLLKAGSIKNREYRVRRRDGTVFYASITGVVHRGENGEPLWIDGVIEDINERKKLEAQRERVLTQEKSAHALAEQAIRARDQFISIASHELKTPLTTLQLTMRILKKLMEQGPVPASPDVQIDKLLARNVQQINRLTLLVENLLDISRISSGKLAIVPEPTDLSHLVAELVDRFSMEFGHRVEFEPKIEPGVMAICDRIRVEQAVSNLMTNAVKFGENKPIAIALERHNRHVRIVVEDRGIGIGKENQAKIFNPYDQAVSSQHYGGLGLGLYIARQVVQSHGGDVWVESELGHGSRFIIEFPLDGAGAAAAAAKPDSESIATGDAS